MTNDGKPTALSDDDLDKVVGGGPGALTTGTTATGAIDSDISSIMSMVHKMSLEQRAVAREARSTDRASQLDMIEAQATKMRDVANLAMASGIVSGVASIAQGAIGMGQSGGLKSISSGIETGQTGAGESISRILGGSVSQTGQQASSQKEIEAKAGIQAGNQSEFMENIGQMVQDMRAKLQEVSNAQTEALRTINRV